MIAAITLLFILTLSALITRVAAIALIHTGLSSEVAKFQARSAYTGSGFTSKETEQIMNHPVRRRIIYILMLVGNAGVVTTISSLMLTFILPERTSSLLYSILFMVVGLSFLWWAIKSPWVDKWLSKMINKALKKYTDIDVKDYLAVLHLAGEYQISELKVSEDSWLADRNLAKLNLRKEGINVLGIEKVDGSYIGSPNGNTKIEVDDKLTLYGRAEVFKNIEGRKRDFWGDLEHEEVVKEQKEISKKE